ncbi:MAG: peptide-methionine (S)-S-oxide reductase MsrA [Firmicutes bacterium]|nr:peptide-methionine (S)-S-oxide reductase MsrA [Bacillota bacterium]HKM18141.1 peptide-methionine (S)-S-oxide reductase MsrA [Limnochordia bacterium]
MTGKLEQATFGGGCFWCLEAVFADLKGVEQVLPGYAGGTVPNPSYELVCTGTTNHAEVVRVIYDPAVISYEELLDVFFSIHDPTTPNRQGEDIGTQYRSVVFYHDQAQKAAAEKAVRTHQQYWADPIVTEIAPLTAFYPAEDYHREYFRNNPDQSYCRLVINPKVQKFRAKYKDMLKRQA